jgi:hypothetical protein
MNILLRMEEFYQQSGTNIGCADNQISCLDKSGSAAKSNLSPKFPVDVGSY